MPGYTECCAACRMGGANCVCGQAPSLSISTRLIVVIHSKEWRRSTNTGHLARLAIKDGEVRLHGLPHQTVSDVGVDSKSSSTLVLFPGRGAQPLTADYLAPLIRPLTLLVPDGNWNQAQHMMRRVPMLCQAHPVRLDGPSLGLRCLRYNRCADRMSTFEAIALALGILEGRGTEDHLLKFFQQFLDRMVHNSRKTR
jgi:DTW domain-containing protein